MARSHHRKKHKAHLRQFKNTHEAGIASYGKAKSKAIIVFGILGALIGFAVGYFGSSGSLLWAALGLAGGAATGYYLGRNIDRGNL